MSTLLVETTGGRTILLFTNNILFMAANNDEEIHVVLRDEKHVDIKLPSEMMKTSAEALGFIANLLSEGATNDDH